MYFSSLHLAAVVIIYTLFGGLYSVAYTDVVQLGFHFCWSYGLLYHLLCNMKVSVDIVCNMARMAWTILRNLETGPMD